MATTKTSSADERACPYCAETIKSAAIVCKHCKRDLPTSETASKASESSAKTSASTKQVKPQTDAPLVSPEKVQVQRSAANRKAWGIILVVFGGLALLSGDYSVGKFLFFIVLPLAAGIWLIRKAASLQASVSGNTPEPKTSMSTSAAKAIVGVTSKTEDFTKVVSEKSKAFFAVKKNLYISVGAFAAILALIIGLGIKSDADEQARVAEAAAIQEQQDKEQAAQDLAVAIEDAKQLLTDGTTRYDESVAWSNDTDRETLKTALSKLDAAIKSKKLASITDATTKATEAYALVGTQAEATARAEAAAKAAAEQAEKDRIAAETIGQKNATAKAKSYLRFQAFSRQGLIEQLEYEGFSLEDSTYGTDYSGADWYEQAVKKGASYLKYQSFSRQGLLEQLLYEGFTPEEAEHGVSQNGY